MPKIRKLHERSAEELEDLIEHWMLLAGRGTKLERFFVQKNIKMAEMFLRQKRAEK